MGSRPTENTEAKDKLTEAENLHVAPLETSKDVKKVEEQTVIQRGDVLLNSMLERVKIPFLPPMPTDILQRSASALDRNVVQPVKETATTVNKTVAPAIEAINKTRIETGEQIGNGVTKTAEQLRSVAEYQMKALMDPERSVGEKIMRGTAIAALVAAAGYGLYQLAKWVVGKPEDSFFGKMLKFCGITAIAGWAMHRVGAKVEKLTPPEKPLPETQDGKALIESLKDGENIVGKPVQMKLNGQDSTVTVKENGVDIDGSLYTFTKVGTGIFDPELDLHFSDAKRSNDSISLTMGRYGISESQNTNGATLIALLQEVAKGKTITQQLGGRSVTIKKAS